MMSRMLFAFQLRKQLTITLLFSALASLLSVGAVLLYEEQHILALADARAQSPAVFTLFGVGGSASLLAHLGALLHGFLLPALGTVLAALLAARLMAAQVATGEMTYWLAMPRRRGTHVLTQWAVLLACMAIFTVIPALAAAVAALVLQPGALQPLWLAQLHLGLFLLYAAIGSLCLMLSCGMDEGRRARRAGLLLCGLLLVIGLVSRLREVPGFVRYLSFYSLFDVPALTAGRPEAALLVLPALAVLFLLVGMRWFSGRDLPL